MPEFAFETLFGVGILLLAIVIGWGIIATKRRSRADIALTEEAVRQRKAHPDTYDEEIKPKLEKKAEH